MRGLAKLPDSYFDKYKHKKVHLKPFNPNTKKIAYVYIKKLKKLLRNFNLDILLRGSTLFEIDGKGEIEIGVYPQAKDWLILIDFLKNHFGKVDNLEKSYARFNDLFKGIEVEIILIKGHQAVIDKKLTNYLLIHPDLLKTYERIKYQNCHSKKDYMIEKDKFFRQICQLI